ncbi:MAG: RNA-binding S4 domain-containing protein [Chromatiales bacterium]|nr:RNA-binding S4 domain-containing protein [Chromatiales bacterium]
MADPLDKQRLDKWLWAARFFKTRQLSVAAIEGGKIRVDGQRPKPSRLLIPGSRITVRKGSLEWRVTVAALSKQRGSAEMAAGLYIEDPDSHAERQRLTAELRDERASAPAAARPGKRDRRLIHRFKRDST